MVAAIQQPILDFNSVNVQIQFQESVQNTAINSRKLRKIPQKLSHIALTSWYKGFIVQKVSKWFFSGDFVVCVDGIARGLCFLVSLYQKA